MASKRSRTEIPLRRRMERTEPASRPDPDSRWLSVTSGCHCATLLNRSRAATDCPTARRSRLNSRPRLDCCRADDSRFHGCSTSTSIVYDPYVINSARMSKWEQISRPESRVHSSLMMGERYICRTRTQDFALSLSRKICGRTSASAYRNSSVRLSRGHDSSRGEACRLESLWDLFFRVFSLSVILQFRRITPRSLCA